MDTIDPTIDLAAETLRGDLRDALLSWFKAQPKAWPYMTEREQRDLANAADRATERMVREACGIIAAAERPCIVATLEQYSEKDGLKIVCKAPGRREVVGALHEACGREVLIVTSGAEEHLGERGPAEITADQGEVPLMDGRYGPGND